LLIDYFKNITFGEPYFFGLLLLLPFLIFWYVAKHKAQSASLLFSHINPEKLHSPKASFIHLPFILRLCTIACIIVALANPQTKFTEENTEGEGIEIILCMDVSGSMTANDLKPTRLEAAKKVAIDFVNQRLTDKIGVVIFSGESFTQCPITTDKRIIVNAIENIHSGLLTDGTAIGDGLSTSVDRIRNSQTKSKIIILLTDGENNGGIIDPKYAKEIAKRFGIKVYTIGVGTDGTTTQQVQTDFGDVVTRQIKVSIDEKLLTQIARETGGKYFRAKDNDGLAGIYESINKLEKSTIDIKKITNYSEKFLPFALAALFFLVLEIILRYLVFRKFP
jgi:Ca-activated chloride channel homolog